MTVASDFSRTCELCGRPLKRKQTVCECGAVLRSGVDSTDELVAGFDYGELVPWVPLVGVLGCVWLIIHPGLITYTWMPLFKIYGVVAILSAATAMLASARMEAQQWRHPDDSHAPLSGMSPVSWFLGIVVAWPVFFPLFLYAHYRKISPARMWIGCIGAALFVLLIIYCLFALRSKPMVWPTAQVTNKKVPKVPDYIKAKAAHNAMPVYPDQGTGPLPQPTPQATVTGVAPAVVPTVVQGQTQPAQRAPAAAIRSASKRPSDDSSAPSFGVSVLPPSGGR